MKQCVTLVFSMSIYLLLPLLYLTVTFAYVIDKVVFKDWLE